MAKKTETRASTTTLILDAVYKEDADFPRGVLPTQKDVLCAMLYLLNPARAGKYQRDVQGICPLTCYMVSQIKN